jgi:hypothetical protein
MDDERRHHQLLASLASSLKTASSSWIGARPKSFSTEPRGRASTDRECGPGRGSDHDPFVRRLRGN